MMTYFVLSLAWGVIGFAAGYLVGRMAREVHEVKKSVDELSNDQENNGEES